MPRAQLIPVPSDHTEHNPWERSDTRAAEQQWYRLASMAIPYRSLLVEVRGQLQEPGGFHSCHISHVVFSSLYDFIVHYPGRKETKMNSVCCQAINTYLDSFTYMLLEVALTEWKESP